MFVCVDRNTLKCINFEHVRYFTPGAGMNGIIVVFIDSPSEFTYPMPFSQIQHQLSRGCCVFHG